MFATITTDRPAVGTAVITVEGNLDVYIAPELRATFIELVTEGRYRQVVDLRQTPAADSTGLGVLVGQRKRLQAHGGALTLVVTPGGPVGHTLDITGLCTVIDVLGNLDDALECATYTSAPHGLFPPLGAAWAWAVWSASGELLALEEYGEPRTEAQVRRDLEKQSSPMVGVLEPLTADRLAEVRAMAAALNPAQAGAGGGAA